MRSSAAVPFQKYHRASMLCAWGWSARSGGGSRESILSRGLRPCNDLLVGATALARRGARPGVTQRAAHVHLGRAGARSVASRTWGFCPSRRRVDTCGATPSRYRQAPATLAQSRAVANTTRARARSSSRSYSAGAKPGSAREVLTVVMDRDRRAVALTHLPVTSPAPADAFFDLRKHRAGGDRRSTRRKPGSTPRGFRRSLRKAEVEGVAGPPEALSDRALVRHVCFPLAQTLVPAIDLDLDADSEHAARSSRRSMAASSTSRAC